MTDPAAASDTLDVARHIAVLADERRGADIVILDVRALVDYTDFFVVVSGQSARQNQAIAEHVVRTLKGEKRYAISKAGLDSGSWICLDLGSVVVHVFDPETRARYDLELLWSDAPRVSTKAPEPEPVPVPAKRRRVTRKAAIAGADAGNAPDSERPPEGEPEAPPARKAKPRAKAKPSLMAKKTAARKLAARSKAAPAAKPRRKRS
ncbi:MAG TPA: ribosome silencing factor [Planctomycetota bacterium]|nr:ribosome silencing factor [Planctomycetota bacterium]